MISSGILGLIDADLKLELSHLVFKAQLTFLRDLGIKTPFDQIIDNDDFWAKFQMGNFTLDELIEFGILKKGEKFDDLVNRYRVFKDSLNKMLDELNPFLIRAFFDFFHNLVSDSITKIILNRIYADRDQWPEI